MWVTESDLKYIKVHCQFWTLRTIRGWSRLWISVVTKFNGQPSYYNATSNGYDVDTSRYHGFVRLKKLHSQGVRLILSHHAIICKRSNLLYSYQSRFCTQNTMESIIQYLGIMTLTIEVAKIYVLCSSIKDCNGEGRAHNYQIKATP